MAATFTFVFVAMGQGDCCMVRCPDGKIVVIDCGSTNNKWGNQNWVDEAAITLRAATWAGGNGNKIDALILTHSDADHHNKVVQFFNAITWKGKVTLPSSGTVLTDPSVAKVNIDKVFLSDAYAADSPLGNYTGGNLNNHITGGTFSTTNVSEVTINSKTDTDNGYRLWTSGDSFKTPTSTQIAGKKLTILSGTTESTAWSVSIVAGNVVKGYGKVDDGATPDNAKSLITLFEVGGKKALLCGDATLSTEKFLLDVHKTSGLLSNVDLVQIPHHGSRYASGPYFVQLVNPGWAVASVGFLEHSFRLPRYDPVIERWLDQVERPSSTTGDHDIDYWTTQTEASKPIKDSDVMTKYNTWTKTGTDFSLVDWNDSKNFYFLKNPGNGVFAFYNQTSSSLFMFRETINSRLVLTSQKNQVFDLTSAGITYRG